MSRAGCNPLSIAESSDQVILSLNPSPRHSAASKSDAALQPESGVRLRGCILQSVASSGPDGTSGNSSIPDPSYFLLRRSVAENDKIR